MAVINFYDNTFNETSENIEVKKGSILKNVIQEHVNKTNYGETVEVYIPDEDKTIFVPLEPDNFTAVVMINGKEGDLDYSINDNDVIKVVIIPKSGNTDVAQNIATGIGWTGVGIAAIGALSLAAVFAIALAPVTLGASLGAFGFAICSVGATVGLPFMVMGTGMALGGFIAASNLKDNGGSDSGNGDSESLLTLNGGSNQDLTGNRYPLILGRHLVNPYIVGSPYHTTYNRHWHDSTEKKDVQDPSTVISVSTLNEPCLTNQTLEKDHEDLGQYYQALYCVGYGPLKLTDFRIGDFILSYNRATSLDINRKSVLHGTLRGTSATGNSTKTSAETTSAGLKEVLSDLLTSYDGNPTESHVATKVAEVLKTASTSTSTSSSDEDVGDILNKWKNNDVTIEILQAGDLYPGSGKYGSIYPVTVKEDTIESGSLLYAYDKTLSDVAASNNITYKGVSVPIGYRTNSVRFSKECPYRLEVELDMGSGLYATRTEQASSDSEAITYYREIPIHVAVQWRFAKSTEKSSNAESPEGWTSFDSEIYSSADYSQILRKPPVTYTKDYRQAEINMNLGLTDGTAATNNEDWIGAKVFELTPPVLQENITWENLTINQLINLGVIKKYTIHIFGMKKVLKKKRYGVGDWRWTTIFEWDGTTQYFNYYAKGPNYDETLYQLDSQTLQKIYCTNIKDAFAGTNVKTLNYWTVTGGRKKKTTNSPITTFAKLPKYTKDGYNLDERRYVFEYSFTPSEIQQMIQLKGSSSDFDCVEVRVLRITPCYLEQSKADDDLYSAVTYQDLVKWTYLRTWQFDKDKYKDAYDKASEDERKSLYASDYPQRPVSEDDLNKFCYVALRLKQDVAETGGSSLGKVSCIAQSLIPKYDPVLNKWSPTKNDDGTYSELEITKKYKYYFIDIDAENDSKKYVSLPIPEDNALYTKLGFDNADPDEYNMLYADYQYEYGILNPDYAPYFIKKENGSDFSEQIRNEVFVKDDYSQSTYHTYPFYDNVSSSSVSRLSTATYNYICSTFRFTDEVENKFVTNNSASVGLYSLIGTHLKDNSKTLECAELDSFGQFYEFCRDVTDGSKQSNFTSPASSVPIAITSPIITILQGTTDSEVKALLEKMKSATINAVWEGCYDDIVERIIIELGITKNYNTVTYYKAAIERMGILKAADGLRHMTYAANGVISSGVKLEDLFTKILATGRGSYRRSDNNKYEIIIGKPNNYPVTVLNQRNVISKSNTRSLEETISGYLLTYTDENDNFEQNTIYVMDDGEDYKNPTKRIESLQIPYITNPYQARSIARFNLACTLYQKEAYTRTVGYLGYALGFGDLVLLQDDSLLVGTDNGAIIKQILIDAATNRTVGFVTDDMFDYTGETDDEGLCTQGATIVQSAKYGQSRCVTVRFANDSKVYKIADKAQDYDINTIYYSYINEEYELSDPQPQNQEELDADDYYCNLQNYQMVKGKTNLCLLEHPIFNDNQFSEDSDIDGVYYTYKPEVENLVAFGVVGKITTKALVMGIKPKDKGQFELSLVPYNENLYNFGEKIPYYKPSLTTPKREEIQFNFTEYQTSSDIAEAKADTINKMLTSVVSATPEDVKNPVISSFKAYANNSDFIKLVPVMESGLYNIASQYEFNINRATKEYIHSLSYVADKLYYILKDGNFIIASIQPAYSFTKVSKYDEEKTYYYYYENNKEYYICDPQPSQTFSKIYTYSEGQTFYILEDNEYKVADPQPTPVYEKQDTFTDSVLYYINKNYDFVEKTEFDENETYFINVDDVYRKADPQPTSETFSEDTYYAAEFNYIDNWIIPDNQPSEDEFNNKTLIPSDTDYYIETTFSDGNYYIENDMSDYYIRSKNFEDSDFGEDGIYYEVDETSTWKEITPNDSNNYYYDRAIDGYPEKSELSNWSIRCRAINQYGLESEWIEAKLDVSNYKTWICEPSSVPGITVIAERNGYRFTRNESSSWSKDFYGDVEVLFSVELEGFYSFKTKENTFVTFDSQASTTAQKYPEESDLKKSVITIQTYNKTTNTVSKSTYDISASLDTSSYGTWEVNTPLINTRVSDRTITLLLNQPARSDNKAVYGTIRYRVQIKKYGQTTTVLYSKDGVIFYSDGEYTEVYTFGDGESAIYSGTTGKYYLLKRDTQWYAPATSKDPYASEDNYKDPDNTDGYVESSNTYVQTMPLNGQDNSDVGMYDTTYAFRVQAYNEAHESEWSEPVNAVALCTSIRDIVKANENYKQLYVSQLAAISANMGVITQGAFGDWSQNHIAMSTFKDDNGQQWYEGMTRLGGDDQYFKVSVKVDEDNNPIYTEDGKLQYEIELKAGSINLTSSGLDFDKGTYIYDENNSNRRMKLSADGISMENYAGGIWTTISKVIIDEQLNLTVTNSNELPDKAVGVNSDCNVYHFNTGVLDEKGKDSENLNLTSIIDSTENYITEGSVVGSYSGEISKVTDKKQVVILNKGDFIEVGQKKVNTDGTVEDTWNSLASSDWGLTDEQLAEGVFKRSEKWQ